MFTRNTRHRGDQRYPSVRRFDFLETQNHACAQPGFDRADMSLDLLPCLNGLSIRAYQGLRESSVKMIARLHRPGVEPVGKLNEKDRALRQNVGGHRRRIL